MTAWPAFFRRSKREPASPLVGTFLVTVSDLGSKFCTSRLNQNQSRSAWPRSKGNSALPQKNSGTARKKWRPNDLRVLAFCSNGQAEEATLEVDHIARRRTCRELRELGQRPLALLRRLRSIGLAQGAPNAVRVQICAIDGRPGLLSPGLVERSRVDAVEAELVDEGQDRGLGQGVVAGDGESDPILRSFRPAPLRQEVRSDVVEHLHHGSPEHAGNPTRLGARFFDGRDAAVAKRG